MEATFPKTILADLLAFYYLSIFGHLNKHFPRAGLKSIANVFSGKKDSSPTKTPKPQKRTLKGGIVSEDIRVGNGPEAKAGKHVGMYYKGTLTKSGKQFDQCLQGKPFKFKLGKGEVIKGWDIGVEGMKVGGKRKLTIPASMGYGAQGAGAGMITKAAFGKG